MTTNSSSTVEQLQVFINFRGADLRYGFISFLERELDINNIKYYIDTAEIRGKPVSAILEAIKKSDIALVFFSQHYANSEYCLDELVEIMENMKENELRVIPIFFRVKTDDVQEQKKEFGAMLYGDGRRKKPNMAKWEEALESIPTRMGLVLKEESPECDLLVKIIKSIKEVEVDILKTRRERRELSNMLTTDHQVRLSPPPPPPPPYGMEQRLKQLEERLDFNSPITQIVGIVGMSGIGKTTLAKMHFEKHEKKLLFRKFVPSIREKTTNDASWLKTELLDGTKYDEARMFKMKMFVVLDDVSGEEQIQYLFDNLNLIKKGSKIVITTRDKSWIEGLGHGTYVVPGLNQKDALQLFAFSNQNCTQTNNFLELSKSFVDYAGGNPRALDILGKELRGKDEQHWREELKKLPLLFREKIRDGFKMSYDELTDEQKEAFLDIACFFRSEDEGCVTSLLSSKDPARDVRDLADKFMINVSVGQIEMPDIMCSLGKDLGVLVSVQDQPETRRLWDHDKVINALVNSEEEDSSVRGILLDVSKLETGISIPEWQLTLMPNLQYLKIFDSSCPRQCKVVNTGRKVDLPDELSFTSDEHNFTSKKIRYFHWLKFPLTQLPADFEPENLIDLRLPYSNIESIWEVVKDAPNLKRVDLSYSEKLINVSALSKAKSLQRLNLEGCIKLVDLPEDTESLQSLTFLNLKGCKSLSSLPEKMVLESLETLILSDCSNFKRFKVISNNLKHLHLDGTIIETLPRAIQNLQSLIVLNLKDCKMLEYLPDCLDKLKALEELILSGCSRLQRFPEIKEKMERMQVLLLDRTSIKEVPTTIGQVNLQRLPQMNGLSLLRRLCLSRNEEISSLQSNISELHHLKWIDLKYCSNLTSISTLPPNLQCLDAHACTSLKTVASPLAVLREMEHVPSSFIFTNCEKLEHASKNEITSYGYEKGQLLSKTLNRHRKGLSFEALVATCFPGSEVPAWFDHKASGAELEPELPRHWTESGFVGIALCAIVSFEEQKIQNNVLQVKCICDFNNVRTSSSYFNCPVGGLSEMGNEERTIKSTHVFIGYTNWLNIKKCQEEGDGYKECVPTKASIKFQVTVDIGTVTNCKVLKCGFSLVYQSGSREAISRTHEVEQDVVEELEGPGPAFNNTCKGERIANNGLQVQGKL